jgi:sarcosine oxidase subunit gamma
MGSGFVAEFTLTARPALGGYAREWERAALVEVERTLVSLSGPGREILGLELPAPGRFAAAEGVTAYWIGPEQWLLAGDAGLFGRVRAAAADAAMTEQTDAWAQLRLTGPAAVAALERLCKLDLSAFPEGSAARTAMEHLGVVIAREEGGFLLMSPRSSARSFAHALETALDSVSLWP